MTLVSAMAADLTAFFKTDDFAEAATFTHAGTLKTVNVIFDDAFTTLNPATGEVESSSPQAEYISSEITAVVHGDTLLVGAVLYTIIGIQPSDDGFITTLILSRETPGDVFLPAETADGSIIRYNLAEDRWEVTAAPLVLGDMTKAVYDIDADGVVEEVEKVDGGAW